MIEECVSCGKQYDDDEAFFRSEFATDEYCMSCSEDAHRSALYENGLDAEYIEKEMKDIEKINRKFWIIRTRRNRNETNI